MSTRTRFLLSIAALVVMLAAMSVSDQRPAWDAAAAWRAWTAGAPSAGAGWSDPAPAGRQTRPDRHVQRMPGGVTHTVILEEHPGGFGVLGGKSLIIDPTDGIIPYQPWALAERNRRSDDANGYEDQVGHCEFYDIGRVHSFAQAYMFSGNNFIINDTQHITRVMPMDRREHLPVGIRLWLGDPIGRWEGDTLVVDTTNFNGRTRMALGGDFYSADAHIVERFTMIDSNTINWTMTIDDPKVFTRPWTMTSPAPMKRMPAGPTSTAKTPATKATSTSCT